jgi:hypothetical protein
MTVNTSKTVLRLRDTDVELRWMLVYIYTTILLLLINTFYKLHITNEGLLASILFGVTSGVLALLGLVAIFVSINSQHKIQKCKEAYWNMLTTPRKESNPKVISTIISSALKDYSLIYRNDENFMFKVISVCKKGIIFVTFSWAIFIGSLEVKDWLDTIILLFITFFGIYILLLFHKILSNLNDIGYIGELKSLQEILDVAINPEIESIYLLAGNLRLINGREQVESIDDLVDSKTMIYADLIVPVNNFSMKLEWIGVNPKKFRNGYKFEPMGRFISNANDYRFNIEIPTNDFSEIIDNWKEKGIGFRYPLFNIRNAEVNEITIEDNMILIPYGTEEIELLFNISKPNSPFLDVIHPFKMLYVVKNFASHSSYQGDAGLEVNGDWMSYE